MEKYIVNGQSYIEDSSAIRPAFWRVSTDNDMGAFFQLRLKVWKNAQGNLKLTEIKANQEGNMVTVKTLFLLPDVSAKLNLLYTFNSTGEMEINQQMIADTLSLIHISEPTRRTPISYAVFCLKKKK